MGDGGAAPVVFLCALVLKVVAQGHTRGVTDEFSLVFSPDSLETWGATAGRIHPTPRARSQDYGRSFEGARVSFSPVTRHEYEAKMSCR